MKAEIEGSLVNAPAGNAVEGSANSIVFVGKQGTVFGDVIITDEVAVDAGETLIIPAGASLTVAADGILVNNSTIAVLGTLNGAEGTIVCHSHCGGAATCAAHAVRAVCAAHAVRAVCAPNTASLTRPTTLTACGRLRPSPPQPRPRATRHTGTALIAGGVSPTKRVRRRFPKKAPMCPNLPTRRIPKPTSLLKSRKAP